MEETSLINQIMTQLSNMIKSERYQQDKEMVIQQVVCHVMGASKIITG